MLFRTIKSFSLTLGGVERERGGENGSEYKGEEEGKR